MREAVCEPAAFAASRTRTTSPPTLLGRKLLKKVATMYDWQSLEKGVVAPSASSRTFHRTVERTTTVA